MAMVMAMVTVFVMVTVMGIMIVIVMGIVKVMGVMDTSTSISAAFAAMIILLLTSKLWKFTCGWRKCTKKRLCTRSGNAVIG